MVRIEDVKEYEDMLNEARSDSQSGIIPNDNIMNTYCVLNYMLKNCNSIQIYSGQSRLLTKNGKDKLTEIADEETTKYLYDKTLHSLEAFLNDPQKSLELISEKEPAELEENIKSILADKKNFSFKVLKDPTKGNYEYHFMVGDFMIYRRETNDANKNGVIKIAYLNEELENCKILKTAFKTINNDILVKDYNWKK